MCGIILTVYRSTVGLQKIVIVATFLQMQAKLDKPGQFPDCESNQMTLFSGDGFENRAVAVRCWHTTSRSQRLPTILNFTNEQGRNICFF